MNNVTHTPGPWVPEGPEDNIHIVRAHEPHMRVAFLTSNGPTKANGYLIAAAPCMAAELRDLEIELESFIECDTSPTADWLETNLASIRAILARSEGRTE